jgi:uncharacterized repeat protein (TIGR02543 family)
VKTECPGGVALAGRVRAASFVLVVLTVLLLSATAHAAVSPFWQELGGSASGDGVSQTPAPKAVFDDTSVAVGSDGLPVVVYAEFPDAVATQAAIIVKRWNATAWDTLGGGGIGQGYLPQVRISPDGDIYVAWLRDDDNGNSEIRLRVCLSPCATFGELGGSDSAGGITGTNSGITFPFSLAVGSDSRPTVAFLASALTGTTDVTTTPAVLEGFLQAFVRRWNGSAWAFVGSDYAGAGVTDGSVGASTARSFATSEGSAVIHSVETPALTLDASGEPVVAFTYITEIDGVLTENTDIYVARWNGTAWVSVGSAVPPGDGAAGRGGPGGVSNSAGGSLNPSIATTPAGGFALAWEETPAGAGALYVWVRVWNGSAWVELGGSATDSGFTEPDTTNGVPQIAVGPDGRPVVAWNALTPSLPAAQIFVLRWDGVDTWREPGLHAASDAGISDAAIEALAPALALTPAAGVPIVAWLDARDPGSAQVFLRRLDAGPAVPLTVGVTGGGAVISSPIGVECPGVTCSGDFPTGTQVTLTAAPDTGGAFTGWGGACSGLSPTCSLMLNANTTVTASFKRFRVTVGVNKPAVTFGQGALGTVSNDELDCGVGGGTCFIDVPQGEQVAFQATPAPGNRFLSWSGGPCSGRTNATCEFKVAANTSSIALFRGITDVDVVKDGNGTGTVTGVGFACGLNCSETVFTGTSVTLTATAATGSIFRGWTSADVPECASKPSGTCVFVASGPNRSAVVTSQSVTAAFELRKHSLKVEPKPNGTVTSDPLPGAVTIDCSTSTTTCSGVFDYSTPVLLRATPGVGFAFAGWSGVTCLAGGAANASCAFLLTGNVTAATPTFRVGTRVTVVKDGNGLGTVSGVGIACGSDCSENVFDGKAIALTAAPATGSRFMGWGDACAFRGMNTSCSFVPAGNPSVRATFQLIPLLLKVTPRTNGNAVNVTPLPDPIDCGAGQSDCEATINYSTPVKLQATPIAGSRFVSWTGCTSVVGTNCSFTMTANRTVTATYRDVTSLALTKIGQGTITSLPAGISCGLTCSSAAFDFARNVIVKLTPAPRVGWDFTGWSGDPSCPGTGPCSFNTSASLAIAVTGNFSIQLKTLTVTVVGSGTVNGPSGFTCDAGSSPCAQAYPYNTLAALTPVAAPGFVFTGWTQSCTGAVPTSCKPLMTVTRPVTATFKPVFGVTVARQGNGLTAATNITATGINCGLLDCLQDYLANTVVTFSRSAPPAGRKFRWLGDCSFRGTNASCALTMNANKSVIGEYSLVPLGLTINVSGPGSVTGLGGSVSCASVGCLAIIDYGTNVLLQAIPSVTPQGEFLSWTGCTTVAGANCSVPLIANRTVAASFRPTVSSIAVVAAAADGDVPLLKGARRQYSAVATFSDGSTQDVSAQAQWTSGNLSVVTVIPTTGLVTGVGFGTTNVSALFRNVTGSRAVTADTLGVNGVTVVCRPYGEPTGSLACLPGKLNFEVECQATATFAHGGTGDVTDQGTWTSTNVAIARPTGLARFGDGPVVASFRIVGNTPAAPANTGVAIYTTLGTVGSSRNTSAGNAWVVRSATLVVSNVSVAAPAGPLTVGTPEPLQALASFLPVPGATSVAGCPVSPAVPPQRDFSLVTTWTTSDSTVADVEFGLVDPLAPGPAVIGWKYQTVTPAFLRQGTVPITVQ